MSRDRFNQLFFEFIGETNKVAYELSNDFQPEGITQIEYALLEHLYHFKAQHLKDMSSDLLLTIGTSRKYVNRLVEKDYVIASKDESDKRRNIYTITRKGKVKLDECFFQVIKGVQNKYQHLEDETLKNLTECIQYISNVLYQQP